MRVTFAYHLSALIVATLCITACNSPANRIRPVIHARGEHKYQAMKSAPLIILAEVVNAKLVSEARDVEKPKEVGGPTTPTIPLHLAQISAKVLLTLRGKERSTVQFYSWVFASGKHGGPRLFNVSPGYSHILFLREDGSYLHTVGDYPAYDLDIPARWLAAFVSQWKAGRGSGSDLLERLATIRLKIELERMTSIRRNYWSPDMYDLIGLTSPFFIAGKLDSFCREFPNPFGRYASCESTAREFPGRCVAYRMALVLDTKGVESGALSKQRDNCEAAAPERIQFYRSTNWQPLFWDREWRSTPERRRLTMRLYASAMDTTFHNAACQAAASMPEAIGIPECTVQ
jgi:hypothetical protein